MVDQAAGRRRARRGAGRGRAIALAVLALLAALLAWYWRPIRLEARAGAAFGAKIGCSCRYVAGRPLADCRTDFAPHMAFVTLSEDPRAHAVTARVPLIARDTARLLPGQGCRLDRYLR